MESTRQVRAHYNDKTIRVYQAYNDIIANSAIYHGTLQCPEFKIERMTWIKPSFLWMMYRSGWGNKDINQKRILAIDISREGFEWALKNACLTHYDEEVYSSREEWELTKAASPVKVQWDPERNIDLAPLHYKAIQIGLSKDAVNFYLQEWIQNIFDITSLVRNIHQLLLENEIQKALSLVPSETIYTLPNEIQRKIGITAKPILS